MKIILVISLVVVIVFGCKQKNNQHQEKPARRQSHNRVENEKKTIHDIDSTAANLNYVVQDGIIVNTIFLDSLIEKVKIVNSKIIDGKTYLACSKYLIEDPIRYDLSFYYEGHFIFSTNLKNSTIPEEELMKITDLNLTEAEIEIGSSCSHHDRVDFERLTVFPNSDSIIYIYTSLPLCSEYYEHIVFKKEECHYTKLVEIESSDEFLYFQEKNDSVIMCYITEFSEDKYEKYLFEYNSITNTQSTTIVKPKKEYRAILKDIELKEIDNILENK